jgi:hypothetical protein
MLLMAMLLAAACGSPDNAGSCDQRNASWDPQPYCQDYQGEADIVENEERSCNGDWADALCPHAQSLGGCRSGDSPIAITTWFYSGGPYATADTVKSSCTGGGVYVAP